ncbi:hypothetical protein EMCRGX_G016930 [Ephydatia muelleri]
MGKEIPSSPSYEQFIQKRVKEDEGRRRIQIDSQPPPRLRASPQRKETHTQQNQAQSAKIKPLMQNLVLAPNQDVTQGAGVWLARTATVVGPRLAEWCLGPEGLDLAREWGWSQAISGPGKLELGLAGGKEPESLAPASL